MADNVKVTIKNAKATVARLQGQWNSKVLPQLAEVIATDCNAYVRMQSGVLADSMRIEKGGQTISWNTPYARRMYYTGTPRHNRNPMASLMWCEKAKGEHIKEWETAANNLSKGASR